MSKKICVYTCITGDYDNLHEIESPEKNVDYLCFTNNKNIKSKTWKIIPITNDGLDNHYLSRKIKMLGSPIISKSYDISVWMDASVVWQKPVSKFVDTYLKNSPFSAFTHNERASIFQEAIACMRLAKDSKEKIISTIDFLKSEAFPDNLGLYEMTVFIKRHNDETVKETMHLWFDTILKFSKRDQLSFMYAAWKTNLQISPIELNIWDNPWFYTTKHNVKSEIGACNIYYGNPDENYSFNQQYIYDYKLLPDNFYQISTTIPIDTKEIEINPTNLIGVLFSSPVITPTPKKILVHGSFSTKAKEYFCTSHNTIKLHGNFKKGQKFTFTIKMKILSHSELHQLIENLWADRSGLVHQINLANNQKAQAEHQLQSILNSKSWKTLEKARKIISPFKHGDQ